MARWILHVNPLACAAHAFKTELPPLDTLTASQSSAEAIACISAAISTPSSRARASILRRAPRTAAAKIGGKLNTASVMASIGESAALKPGDAARELPPPPPLLPTALLLLLACTVTGRLCCCWWCCRCLHSATACGLSV